MKRKKIIVLSIVCTLAVVLGLFIYMQRDNIVVLSSIGKYSTEELQQMMVENVEARTTAVADIKVRELTEEERIAIQKGELSHEDAVTLLIQSTGMAHTKSESTSTNQPQGDSSKGSVAEESETDYDAELAKLIGDIYVLEAVFSGSIEDLLDSAIAEYTSLPPEMHTTPKKLEIGARYLEVASGMEKNCDEKMATVLSQIERVLIASGRDTELVRQIKDFYQNEKILTKNYYLSLYA